jgi:hypothetical protein
VAGAGSRLTGALSSGQAGNYLEGNQGPQAGWRGAGVSGAAVGAATMLDRRRSILLSCH